MLANAVNIYQCHYVTGRWAHFNVKLHFFMFSTSALLPEATFHILLQFLHSWTIVRYLKDAIIDRIIEQNVQSLLILAPYIASIPK